MEPDVKITRLAIGGIRAARISSAPEAAFSRRHNFAGIGLYLQVSPDTVWLTEANGFSDDFIVESNVEWKIYREE